MSCKDLSRPWPPPIVRTCYCPNMWFRCLLLPCEPWSPTKTQSPHAHLSIYPSVRPSNSRVVVPALCYLERYDPPSCPRPIHPSFSKEGKIREGESRDDYRQPGVVLCVLRILDFVLPFMQKKKKNPNIAPLRITCHISTPACFFPYIASLSPLIHSLSFSLAHLLIYSLIH